MERAKHSVEQVRQVVHGFQAWGDFIDAQPYGSGHINDTYKVSARLAGTPVNYLVQRINHATYTTEPPAIDSYVRFSKEFYVGGVCINMPPFTTEQPTGCPVRPVSPDGSDDDSDEISF